MTLKPFLSKTIPAFLGMLLVGAWASAGESPLKVTSFTAKAKVTVVAGPDAEPLSYTADYWVRDEMLRTEMSDTRTNVTVGTIMRDKLVYFWQFGAETGTKVPADSEQGASSASFADIARCLGKGKKLGDETVDGLATTKYSYTDCGGPRGTTTAWIAKKGGFIRQLRMEKDGASMTALFDDVKETQLPEETFMPPGRVPFIAYGDQQE